MKKLNYFLVVCILVTLSLLMVSSTNSAAQVKQTIEIIIPEDKVDRLPGSLKWSSIVLYISGTDFFTDQPEGLSTAEVVITTEQDQTAQSTDQTTQTTTTFTESNVSGTTNVTVDGTMNVTTTTETDGNQDGTTWWDMGD